MVKPEDKILRLGQPESKATDKATDIYIAVRESTASPKAKAIDYHRLELKQDLRRIIERGSEQDFVEALLAVGIDQSTAEGKELLAAFKEMREEH